MNLALGIDTGGTYTDAVIIDHDTGQVMTSAKALTTREDLAIGIAAAIQHVLDAAAQSIPNFSTDHITFVAVSTTLATNALAEGHRATVALILIGYDPDAPDPIRIRSRDVHGRYHSPARRARPIR